MSNAAASSEPVRAAIALGSNLGDREQMIWRAIALLDISPGMEIDRVSELYANRAVGGPVDSPEFLNAAATIWTTLSAQDLLARLLGIETELGRERRERWSPRTIDLDLLLYGDRVIDAPGLAVPHPLMHERRFVLQPLAQIAPEMVHPVLGKTIAELLAALG